MKNFGKDVMEMRSSECCFICIQSKYKNIWIKGLSIWQNVMWEKWNDLPTIFVYLFVARRRKEAKLQEEMSDTCCTTLPHEFWMEFVKWIGLFQR